MARAARSRAPAAASCGEGVLGAAAGPAAGTACEVRGTGRQRTPRLDAGSGAGRGLSEAALPRLAGAGRTARVTAGGPARTVARGTRRPGGAGAAHATAGARRPRSEEHTSELQSLMLTSYAVSCLQKKKPSIQ